MCSAGPRGFTTIVIAHIAFCSAYVTVTVQSRLASADRSLEEAAMDLGAGPVRAFLDTTLPSLAPALASSWLLSFTLSLDDLVISSFVSGPGSQHPADGDFLQGQAGREPRRQCTGELDHLPGRRLRAAGGLSHAPAPSANGCSTRRWRNTRPAYRGRGFKFHSPGGRTPHAGRSRADGSGPLISTLRLRVCRHSGDRAPVG